MSTQTLQDSIREFASRYSELSARQLYNIFQTVEARGEEFDVAEVSFHKFKRLLREVRNEPKTNTNEGKSKGSRSKPQKQSFEAPAGTAESHITSAENSLERRALIRSWASQLTESRESNQMQSLHHAQRHAREEASEWAYHWGYATGGTSNPLAREGYSTLVFKETLAKSTLARARDVDVLALISIQTLCQCGWVFSWEEHDTKSWEDLLFQPYHLLDDTQPFSLTMYDVHTKSHERLEGIFLLRQRGVMQVNFAEFLKIYLPGYGTTEAFQKQKHDFHGPLVQILSTSQIGFAALKDALVDVAPPDHLAFLPHISEVLYSDRDIVIRAVTGLGKTTTQSTRQSKRRHKERKEDGADGVSTFLSLRSNDDEIARCLLTWNNTDCAELGPNIEMLVTRQQRRGQGWLQKFYTIIEQFAFSRWTMTGLTEGGKRRRRIFASYLTGTEVEAIQNPKGGLKSISDKDFFLRYQGFDVRFDAMACIGGCPPDEDAVKYVRASVSRSTDVGQFAFNAPDTLEMTKQKGNVLCHYCARSTLEAQLQLCSRCKEVRYCSRECCTNDGPQHKLWCGKTKDDLEGKMFALQSASS